MKKPAVPVDEIARLEALASYEILDTEQSASFDALTQLAAFVLDVPIALVSLVDADRQWFKSHHGIDVTETARDISFCGHVVADSVPLIVPDALEDSRFADNPLVLGDPRVRFYAGVPLRSSDGFVLGTLCAIDHKPKKPTPQQLHLLSLIAGQVVDQMEALRKRIQISREHASAIESARNLDVLFDAMAEGVVVQDRVGAILSANKAAEQLLGLTVDQMAGRTSLDPRWQAIQEDGTPFPGENHPAMVTLRTGKPCTQVVMGVHKANGDLTWISINALPLRDEGKASAHGVICTFHDMTQTKAARAAEERLSRQERLVTTGTLAAGIGHEINNPLSFILANIDFALEEVRTIAGGSPSGRLHSLIGVLEDAHDGSKRVQKIVRGLRAFAREEENPLPTDVSNAIDISINMAAHEIRQKATIRKSLTTTPLVLTDESRLSQVLVNLLVNAAQSFPTGDVEANLITVSTKVERDGRVTVSVTDNGPGVREDLQRRIFDPFFTTKPVGQGTGLGLSISQSIVTALGGELTLSSEAGHGSTFSVTLPVPDAAIEAKLEGEPSVRPGPRGRVLVIDDEDAIGRVIRRILGGEHEVISVADPREALQQFRLGARFDVVFCDLMMPHLTGDALFAEIQSLDLEQADRFVFLTGGATKTHIAAFLAAVPNERIEKPFSSQNLRGIARRFVRAQRQS